MSDKPRPVSYSSRPTHVRAYLLITSFGMMDGLFIRVCSFGISRCASVLRATRDALRTPRAMISALPLGPSKNDTCQLFSKAYRPPAVGIHKKRVPSVSVEGSWRVFTSLRYCLYRAARGSADVLIGKKEKKREINGGFDREARAMRNKLWSVDTDSKYSKKAGEGGRQGKDDGQWVL